MKELSHSTYLRRKKLHNIRIVLTEEDKRKRDREDKGKIKKHCEQLINLAGEQTPKPKIETLNRKNTEKTEMEQQHAVVMNTIPSQQCTHSSTDIVNGALALIHAQALALAIFGKNLHFSLL